MKTTLPRELRTDRMWCTCAYCREMRWWREYWAIQGRKLPESTAEAFHNLHVAVRRLQWVLVGRWMRWQ